ncbi:hypothetical protein [Psychroflexus salis]|nr:hypothetical protein [Psychroflexus salis]
MLHFDTTMRCTEEQKDIYFIQLSIIDEKEISAKLFKGEILLESKKLKGRIRNNYFRIRTDFKFYIEYIILNRYTTDYTRIGLLQNKNITVDSMGGTCGLILFFPVFCDGNETNNNQFERLITC